jgi:hypothetical protein
LIGLAFLKAGKPDHPRVKEALAECRTQMMTPMPDYLDMYSNGLAIILMCEVSPKIYAREIDWYLAKLKQRQKDHGGWGYEAAVTGDTSQTQYAALSYWEAHRRGFKLEGDSVEKLADWLMRTQSAEGCWGYQGQLSNDSQPALQFDTNCSMLAAGLGSTYICADLLGAKASDATQAIGPAAPAVPAALRPVEQKSAAAASPKFRPQRTSIPRLIDTINHAHDWMKKNFEIDIGSKAFYYLYGLERYKSFQEAFEGIVDEDPEWYNAGYRFLAKVQRPDGSWSGYCGDECDTAFSVLFLLRSTQMSIRARLGEGMLLAGRGLPTNLARAKLRNGQVIVEQVHTKVDELLSMLDDQDEAALDELARDPSQLVVEQVDEKSARRLQQLVRGGEPQVRLLAVRALGRTGDLDYVPTLLYALTDPDERVVLQARDGLRFISRNFDGYGPPDQFTDDQRYQALDQWKKWYLALRPTAVLEK